MKAAVKKAYPNYTDAQCQALVAKLKRMGMGKEAAVKIQPVPGPRRIRMPGKAALMGGAAGLAAGVPIGAVLGYKREQKRLSPQERAVVEQAMRQAYRQGNMAMYNRLKRQVQAQSQKKAAK